VNKKYFSLNLEIEIADYDAKIFTTYLVEKFVLSKTMTFKKNCKAF